MIRLETKQVSKSFDGKKVIEDISISLQKNEIVSLLGVSGAGKTTLFNVISGLMEPDSGEVLFKWGRRLPGQAGHISYMLQKDLLLPYKTIEENVALPLMIKGEKKKLCPCKGASAIWTIWTCGNRKEISKSAVRRNAPTRRTASDVSVFRRGGIVR